MRILIVSPYLPHRAVGHGGGTAIHDMVLALSSEHELRVLCFRRSNETGLEADLEDRGLGVDCVNYRSGADRGLARIWTAMDRAPRLLWAALSGRPYRTVRFQHRGMSDRLRGIIHAWDPDLVQFEYFAMASYARMIRREREATRPRVALSTIEVETLVRMRRLLAAPRGWRRAWADLKLRRIRAYESRASGWADDILCVTQQDAEILRGLSGESAIHTLPLGVRLAELASAAPAEGSSLRFLFMGSFDHLPNREAARWLVDCFAPWMRQRYSGAKLEIVGRNAPVSLVSAASPPEETGVIIHGFVEDLDPIFDGVTLFLAPLSSGGGIKIKILEAMGRGVPVLTTPIGLDGIEAQRGLECACAEPGGAFLAECGRLLEGIDSLPAMGGRGREFIARQHDWPILARRLTRILG